MRLSIDDHVYTPAAAATAPTAPLDPSAPDVSFLAREPAAALQSFFATIERITTDNPVPIPRLQELAGKARQGQIAPAELQELQALKVQATRQGRAVGAVIGFFLKLKPYPMLEEIRKKAKLFQPAFGPVLVVEGDTVRNVLERDQEFSVDPYGIEMMKVMTPAHNGGFTTFILSTDDTPAYEPDKRLLSAVCNPEDADQNHRHHSQGLHAPNGSGSGRGSQERRVHPLSRGVDCALRARDARPQVPWRSRRAATGLVRAHAGDAHLLRIADRRSG